MSRTEIRVPKLIVPPRREQRRNKPAFMQTACWKMRPDGQSVFNYQALQLALHVEVGEPRAGSFGGLTQLPESLHLHNGIIMSGLCPSKTWGIDKTVENTLRN
jgi:hypothetical protein